jgi:hemolysin activation/secretion protein
MMSASAWGQAPPLSAVPQGSPLPRILPPAAPNVAPGLQAPPQPLNTALPGASVAVATTELRGVSVYPPGTFETLLAPLTGNVAQTKVQEVRDTILARYRADGYLFTAVSATLESGGRLVFGVTEGRIVEVKLDGNIGPAGVQVLRFLNHLVEAGPLDIATLERWLLLAQDVPGVTLRTVLRPSSGDPGALSLVAQVSRRPFSGLATADNLGYKGTGPEQFLGSISANSFSQYGEHTDATFFYTARSTELFGQVATELFVGSYGLKVRIYAGKGTTDPTGALGQIGYHGDTAVAGISTSYPVIRRRQETFTLAAFFDLMDSSVDTGTPQVLASRDRLRVFRLGADYALRDVLLGDTRSAVTTASVRLSRGAPGLGGSQQGDTLAGRPGEKIAFTKVAAESTRTQTVATFGEASSFALQATVAGQYSEDVLPSSEEFYLGGLRFNRGFYSGEVTGDRALTAALEAQYNTSFDVPWIDRRFDLGTQFYTFYDWGETWQSQNSDHNARLGSNGIGVRLYFPNAIEVDLEAVNRLTRRPLSASANVAPDPKQAFYWRVIGRF